LPAPLPDWEGLGLEEVPEPELLPEDPEELELELPEDPDEVPDEEDPEDPDVEEAWEPPLVPEPPDSEEPPLEEDGSLEPAAVVAAAAAPLVK